MTHRVVLYSGGLNSWYIGQAVARAALSHDRVTLLFADTGIEDADVYRFLWETSDGIHFHLQPALSLAPCCA